MSVYYTHVRLYPTLRVKVGTENGVAVYKEYTEESYHRPLIGSASSNSIIQYLGTAPYDITGVVPKKGKEFSEMEIPVQYPEVMGMTDKKIPRLIYIQGTTTDVLIGWVDGFEPVATKGPSQNTRLLWHIDWWLTAMVFAYQKKLSPGLNRDAVSFGNGTFKRGPEGMKRPDPSVPRMWINTGETEIVDPNSAYDAPWVIVLYTQTSNGHTTFRMAYWPAGSTTFEYSSVPYYAITPNLVYQGLLEEWMGLDPNAIVGVWFSPIPPASTTGAAVSTGGHTEGDRNYLWFIRSPSNAGGTTITLPDEVGTDDNSKYAITDLYGTIQSVLPWGITFKTIKMRCDIGTSGGWLLLQFLTGDGSGGLPSGEGRLVQIPLLAAPITSNALSSYVYSGQEAYDRDMAKLQQEQALKSGIAGLGSSAISGAVGGAMAGGPAGAAAGAIGGGVLGGVGVAANYFIQGETNDKSMALTRELMSNQTANVVIAGSGPGWYGAQFDHKWKIVKLSRDPLSKGELETEQAEKGYVCDTFTTNCTPTIQSGGPVRIEGLEVKGDIPKVGRLAIAAMFARGVHLDLIQ